MKRRTFGKLLSAVGIMYPVSKSTAKPLRKKQSKSLPAVTNNGNSVEICLNSRYSFHSGYTTETSEQIIANTLWATAQAPLIASERIIYVALSDNLYRYQFQNGNHILEVHAEGDHRTESSTAFEIGVATDPSDAIEDAGVALHWAQLASTAFWSSTHNQPGCCPKDSAMYDANSNWNPASTIHLVNCYGQMSSVNGLKDDLVASSSDSSLPDPVTNGTISLEDTITDVQFGTSFETVDLTAEQISQILWAAYGCTPHSIGAANGLTVASWNFKYFITGKIYVVSAAGVENYLMRNAASAVNSTDHKLTRIADEDVRTSLRNTVDSLPGDAPVYFIFCASKVDRESRLEAGYCGSSALLQATTLGLQGHYYATFSAEQREAIQQVCSLPASSIPLLIFSAGQKRTTGNHVRGNSTVSRQENSLVISPNPFRNSVKFTLKKPSSGTHISIVNIQGREVTRLFVNNTSTEQSKIIWDGSDRYGRQVSPGIYTCVYSLNGKKETYRLNRKK